MPIERMFVPGLDAMTANPNVVGPMFAEAPPRDDDALRPVVMQQGGLVGDAATLQNAGRGGDNMLVHMNPEEVGALNRLGQFGIGDLRRSQMTINPQTGLPEMFSFRDLIPTIAAIAATAMGAGPIVAGLSASGASLASQEGEADLGRALMAGIGAWGGAELMQTVGGAGAASQIPAGEAGSLAMMGGQTGGAMVDPSALMLAQADAPLVEAQLAAATQAGGLEAERIAMLRAIEPVDFGATVGAPPDFAATTGVDVIGGYTPGTYAPDTGFVATEFPTTYADGTPMSPEILNLSRTDPEAFNAALRSPGGTAAFSQQDVARNIGREIWQDNATSNVLAGMKKVSPFEWKASKAGDLGLSELVKPLGASIMGTAGSMPPPEFEPPPSRRSYAYDASGMPPRTFEYESPPEDYVHGEDPEWEYIKDTTPSYDYASGYGLGSAGPPEPYTLLSKHGYRGRGDLPTVNAFLGSSSGTAYPQKVVDRIRSGMGKLPMGFMGGLLSTQLPWEKLIAREEEEDQSGGGGGDIIGGETVSPTTPIHPLAREEEEERLRRVSNYYQPGNWKPPQLRSGHRYAFPAAKGFRGLARMAVGEFVDPMSNVPIAVGDEYIPGTYTQPSEDYVPGFDPQHNYFPNRPVWAPSPEDEDGPRGFKGLLQVARTMGLIPERARPEFQRLFAQAGTEGETVGEFIPGTYTQPSEDYVPGLNPQHNYFPNRSVSLSSPEDRAAGDMRYAFNRLGRARGQPVASIVEYLLESSPEYLKVVNAQAGTEGLVVEEAALRQLPPEEAATTGIMDVAPPAAQDAVADRMAVTPSPDQPQNPEERAIFDQALLALQGVLEPDAAEEAIDVFIEVFGMDAYSELIALFENKMDEGGIVKPANGETTVAMGDVQGPDMIPGNIVDPMTGERTANLNVGENEYIEPATSLVRRAMAAGMPPTPENGALVRGAEEDQLKAMYG